MGQKRKRGVFASYLFVSKPRAIGPPEWANAFTSRTFAVRNDTHLLRSPAQTNSLSLIVVLFLGTRMPRVTFTSDVFSLTQCDHPWAISDHTYARPVLCTLANSDGRNSMIENAVTVRWHVCCGLRAISPLVVRIRTIPLLD